MKKNMRFSYWFGGIAFRTDKHKGHFEREKRLKIKYSTNSNKYTSTSAYNDILGAITKYILQTYFREQCRIIIQSHFL